MPSVRRTRTFPVRLNGYGAGGLARTRREAAPALASARPRGHGHRLRPGGRARRSGRAARHPKHRRNTARGLAGPTRQCRARPRRSALARGQRGGPPCLRARRAHSLRQLLAAARRRRGALAVAARPCRGASSGSSRRAPASCASGQTSTIRSPGTTSPTSWRGSALRPCRFPCRAARELRGHRRASLSLSNIQIVERRGDVRRSSHVEPPRLTSRTCRSACTFISTLPADIGAGRVRRAASSPAHVDGDAVRRRRRRAARVAERARLDRPTCTSRRSDPDALAAARCRCASPSTSPRRRARRGPGPRLRARARRRADVDGERPRRARSAGGADRGRRDARPRGRDRGAREGDRRRRAALRLRADPGDGPRRTGAAAARRDPRLAADLRRDGAAQGPAPRSVPRRRAPYRDRRAGRRGRDAARLRDETMRPAFAAVVAPPIDLAARNLSNASSSRGEMRRCRLRATPGRDR